jgi:hypothetical protein
MIGSRIMRSGGRLRERSMFGVVAGGFRPFATFLLLSVAAAVEASPLVPTESGLRISELRAFTTVELPLPTGVPDELVVRLPIDGLIRTVELRRWSLRAEEFQVWSVDARGAWHAEPAPPVRTYRGTIEDGVGAAMSLVDGGLSGFVDLGDAGIWAIQPARDFDPRARATTHVVYSIRDVVLPEGGVCGVDLVPLGVPDWIAQGLPGPNGSGGEVGEGGIAGAQPTVVEIGFDADFEFYLKNSASVNATVNDIENVMNGVDFIYDRDVDVRFEFTTFVVRTDSSDPYTSTTADGILCEFRNAWNAAPENGIQREVAQLYTGKSLAGSTIGLAWLGVVCNESGNDCSGFGNLAYNIVESRYTTVLSLRQGLSAHELGHNFNATHCDAQNPCHIMCATNGGCDGITGANLKFGASEIAQITAFKNSVSCDGLSPLPLGAPFVEVFPGTLSATNWTYVNGAITTSAATNEPTAPNSLNLDATGAGIYDFDEVRSNRIDLTGGGLGLASFWTQRKGVEAGKSLFVDYWSSAGDWVSLATITSDGVDQVNFVQTAVALPSNALHAGFRIRFRTDSTASNDDWFIDDVVVAIPANRDRVNNDARSDIVLHNPATNSALVWFMNGLVQTGGATNTAPLAGWTAQGTGDFDGDGRADILWRDASNTMRIWLMNGQTVVSQGAIVGAGAVPASFQVIGVADLNGDRKADIVFRNGENQNINGWLMDGLVRTQGGLIGNAGSLQTIGLGDVNADGRADLVLRSPEGVVSGWLLNGLAIQTQSNFLNTPAIASFWAIQAIGDLDGDGRADLVWRNLNTGDVNGWLLNGLARKQGGFMGTIPLAWTLECTADINGDTKSDLVWKNTSTGGINGWTMNGLVKVSGGPIGTLPTTWMIVNQ